MFRRLFTTVLCLVIVILSAIAVSNRPHPFAHLANQVWYVGWSHNSEQFISVETEQNFLDAIYVNTPSTGARKFFGSNFGIPVWSPDDQQIAFKDCIWVVDPIRSQCSTNLFVSNVDGSNKRQLTFFTGDNYYTASFIWAGDMILTDIGPENITAVDPATGAVSTFYSGPIDSSIWLENGRVHFMLHKDGIFGEYSLNLQGNDLRFEGEFHNGLVRTEYHPSPNGKWLITLDGINGAFTFTQQQS